jgi:hypothetical protein
LALGKSISEINKLSSREIVEWEAYDMLYGLPWKRLEKVVATGIAFSGNTNPHIKHDDPFISTDFLPGIRSEQEDTEEEAPDFSNLAGAFKASAIAMGAQHV